MDEIVRQCIAHNRAGERCQKSAMVGQQICHLHGGKNPGALRRAQERLLALAEPALDGLLRALESNDLPAIVSAARIVLDRAGLGPSAHLTVAPAVAEPPYVEWMTVDELDVLDGLLEEARRRKLDGEAPFNNRIGSAITRIERVILDAGIDVTDTQQMGHSPTGKSKSAGNVLSVNSLQETESNPEPRSSGPRKLLWG